jgi:hypothetical protein
VGLNNTLVSAAAAAGDGLIAHRLIPYMAQRIATGFAAKLAGFRLGTGGIGPDVNRGEYHCQNRQHTHDTKNQGQFGLFLTGTLIGDKLFHISITPFVFYALPF